MLRVGAKQCLQILKLDFVGEASQVLSSFDCMEDLKSVIVGKLIHFHIFRIMLMLKILFVNCGNKLYWRTTRQQTLAYFCCWEGEA